MEELDIFQQDILRHHVPTVEMIKTLNTDEHNRPQAGDQQQ